MGKLKDFFLGTSDERIKKQERLERQKKEMLDQREKNKKIRAFYQKRSKKEIQLRQERIPKHKVKSEGKKNLQR